MTKTIEKLSAAKSGAQLVELHTPAFYSLQALNAAIEAAEPETQLEVKYVEERLQYLLAKHGPAAIYALMRQNLKIAIEKGQ